MSWQPNASTTTSKQNPKASMYVEYNNLIEELEKYMPQFKATVKDLQEPSQTFVTQFYTDMFSEFFCDVHTLTEIQVTQNLTYHEMYGETVPILNLCIALRYMYSKLGIDDFGLNDICDPSPKRTYRLLQTMINFLKFSDEKIHEADAKMKAVRNMKERIDKFKKEKDIVMNAINKKLLDRKHRETEIKTLSDDIKVSKTEFMEINKYKDEIQQELDKVKQEQFEIEKTCLKLSELRDNILKNITTLREQIVEAPDLLKADHERFKRMKKDATEKKSAMMAQVTAKKQIVITLEQELAAQEKRYSLLLDVTEKNNRLSTLVHETETMSQNKCEMEESSENLKEKIELLQRGRADIKNKINCLLKEMEHEQNIFKSKYDTLLKAKDKLIEDKNHHFEAIKLLEEEINECHTKKYEIETKITTIIEEFEKTKNEISKQYNDFHSTSINKILGIIN